ncbi:MAG TPA: type I 3-dehydroquinate dehydratase, partial [Thermoplasmata archaeon]|nr:type I 3-dehydroquinate dehydratase [Thermoplasmata archaeon]
MRRRTRIAVTLPARSLEQALREVLIARDAGADFAEVRFDRWEGGERARAAELFPSPLPLIGTIRSASEGGEGPDDPQVRAEWLGRLATMPFALLDAELARDRPTEGIGNGPPWIGSRHFRAGSSVADVERFLTDAPKSCAFVKAVLPLSVGGFLEGLVPRYGRWSDGRTIVTTTGPSGPVARLWGSALGQPLVFAALPADGNSPAVEPSQVPADELRRAWSRSPPRGYAVVGRPLGHSLSPRIHTRWIRAHRHRAAFVPVEIAEPREFDQALTTGRDGRWAGWSVTHPWKIAAATAADERSESVRSTRVANTLTFRDGRIRADLTDASAVARRARELRSSGRWDGREALVVGTGGAA